MSAFCQKQTFTTHWPPRESGSEERRLLEPMDVRTPELPCRLSGRLESSCSIFGCHCDSRLNLRQTASRRRSQHRGSCRLLIWKLTNGQPVMVAKSQVPPDEPTAYALGELGNGFLTIFRLSQHAFEARLKSVNRTKLLRLLNVKASMASASPATRESLAVISARSSRFIVHCSAPRVGLPDYALNSRPAGAIWLC
jgi:hypothetical protein